MRLPVITGVIDRRILANYRVDPACMAAALPEPFRPKIVEGYAIGGICLIRLSQVRPKLFPLPVGISSENAAHRIAVEWETDCRIVEGVYIARRDTNSRLNALAGGRIFPGQHHYATFDVVEESDFYSITMNSHDGSAEVHVSGIKDSKIPESSVFGSIEKASEFFERGSLGYSSTNYDHRYDGLELRCKNWHVDALTLDSIRSNYFEDQNLFPSGSVEFDCALLMRDIAHEWHSRPDLSCNG